MATTEVIMTNAKEFFEEIVKPSVADFMGQPSKFRTAFNAATALYHMHEWLYEFKRAELEAKYGQTFGSKRQFWGHVETLVPSCKFIRDLANASKHVRLTLKPSTSMTHIANTVIQMTGWGDGGYGTGGYGGQTMVMKDHGNDVSVDDCIRDLMEFWTALVAELCP